MNPGANDELITKMVSFLREIGLRVEAGVLDHDTVLPGMEVRQGVLFYDPAKLEFPGDLLHEAGHLAVKSAADREKATPDLGGDPAEEMMTISWSYAAALHLQIPPEVVLHAAGYKGGAQGLLNDFAAGRYLALPMLQWLGLACDEKTAKATGVAPFPKMKHWLRPP
jgi:hypothetical protein